MARLGNTISDSAREAPEAVRALIDGSAFAAGATAQSWRDSMAALKETTLVAAQAAEDAFPTEGLRFLYRPMLDVRDRALGLYNCLPVREDNGTVLTGDAVMGPMAPDSRRRRLDTLVLRDALTTLMRQKGGAQPVRLCIPLHLAALHGPGGADILSMLEALPLALTKRVVYEIVDAASGRSEARAAETIRWLSRRGGAVIGRVNPRDADLRVWKTTGLHLVGIDMEDETLQDADALKTMAVFSATARKQGVPAYARGLGTKEMAIAAITAEFGLIEGPAVDNGEKNPPPRPQPYDMSRLDWG